MSDENFRELEVEARGEKCNACGALMREIAFDVPGVEGSPFCSVRCAEGLLFGIELDAKYGGTPSDAAVKEWNAAFPTFGNGDVLRKWLATQEKKQ
jgi:hypothetical protein